MESVISPLELYLHSFGVSSCDELQTVCLEEIKSSERTKTKAAFFIQVFQ